MKKKIAAIVFRSFFAVIPSDVTKGQARNLSEKQFQIPRRYAPRNDNARRFSTLTIRAVLLTLFFAFPVFAQTPDPGTELGMIMTVSFLVFAVATLMFILVIMGGDVDPIAEAYFRIKNYIVPPKMETEVAEDLGHDFDGIRELDNRIPPWFNLLFLGTIVFAIVYMLDYHVLKISPLMESEYIAEVQAAEVQKRIALAADGEIDENALVALKDEASLKLGAEIFQKFCISCHGPQGGGIVGPNLTDKYWIHGGGVKNVYATIKAGVPAKGMISWQLVFSQKQIQQIASYVLSLQGTNPPGGKAPEGQLYSEPVIAAKDSVKTKSI
ncbi:MAG: cbb3-type cytochrome c oxidase N-terminal domain-containing protein [Bacteroidota bacterium]